MRQDAAHTVPGVHSGQEEAETDRQSEPHRRLPLRALGNVFQPRLHAACGVDRAWDDPPRQEPPQF
jgi:hypothetical protein